jgi:hypothetical protein
MAQITDLDRTRFKEAYLTVLDNFTPEELAVIRNLAETLQRVIDEAKKRLK